jgi:hypothetical protein
MMTSLRRCARQSLLTSPRPQPHHGLPLPRLPLSGRNVCLHPADSRHFGSGQLFVRQDDFQLGLNKLYCILLILSKHYIINFVKVGKNAKNSQKLSKQVKMKALPFYFDLTSYLFICFLFIYLLFFAPPAVVVTLPLL